LILVDAVIEGVIPVLPVSRRGTDGRGWEGGGGGRVGDEGRKEDLEELDDARLPRPEEAAVLGAAPPLGESVPLLVLERSCVRAEGIRTGRAGGVESLKREQGGCKRRRVEERGGREGRGRRVEGGKE